MRVLRKYFVLIAATAMFTSSAQAQTQPSELETAKDLLKSGHADQSLVLVDKIIAQAMQREAKDPDSICPSVAAAFLQSYMKGSFTVSIQNDWCDAMLVKGYALNELKRPVEAEQVLKTLVGHAPGDAQYLIEYSYTVRVNGDLNLALELYRQAEKLASSSLNRESSAHWRAAALRGQGFVLSDLQRWDEATKTYKRSMKYEPESEIALHELKYIEEHRPH